MKTFESAHGGKQLLNLGEDFLEFGYRMKEIKYTDYSFNPGDHSTRKVRRNMREYSESFRKYLADIIESQSYGQNTLDHVGRLFVKSFDWSFEEGMSYHNDDHYTDLEYKELMKKVAAAAEIVELKKEIEMLKVANKFLKI